MDIDDQQTIYYFSQFSLFDETIIQDLLFCKWLKQSILNIMDQGWQEQAERIIYLEKNGSQMFLPLSFFVDTCIYSWILTINYLGTTEIQKEVCQTQFQNYFKQKLYNFKYVVSLFDQLTEQFVDSLLPRTLQIYKSYNQSTYMLKQEQLKKTCSLKPLVAVKEKLSKYTHDPVPIKKKTKVNSDIDQLIKGIDDINIDDFEDKTAVKNQVKKTSPNRSSTEFGDKITNQLKFRKIQKQLEKNFIPQSKFQNWQIALHTVVQIWELRGLQERIRFLQPAEGFYRQIFQLWVIEKCDQKLTFEQFLFKSRHFFSSNWDEKYVVAIHMMYMCLENALEGINSQGIRRSSDQILSVLVTSVVEYMEKIWQKDIIHKAQLMSQQ